MQQGQQLDPKLTKVGTHNFIAACPKEIQGPLQPELAWCRRTSFTGDNPVAASPHCFVHPLNGKFQQTQGRRLGFRRNACHTNAHGQRYRLSLYRHLGDLNCLPNPFGKFGELGR